MCKTVHYDHFLWCFLVELVIEGWFNGEQYKDQGYGESICREGAE